MTTTREWLLTFARLLCSALLQDAADTYTWEDGREEDGREQMAPKVVGFVHGVGSTREMARFQAVRDQGEGRGGEGRGGAFVGGGSRPAINLAIIDPEGAASARLAAPPDWLQVRDTHARTYTLARAHTHTHTHTHTGRGRSGNQEDEVVSV